MTRRLGNPYWRYRVKIKEPLAIKEAVLCQKCLDETLVRRGASRVEIGKYTQAVCDFCWGKK